MGQHVPFSFVVELITILFLILIAYRAAKDRKVRPLESVLQFYGCSAEDIEALPVAIRRQWEADGVSRKAFLDTFRKHFK